MSFTCIEQLYVFPHTAAAVVNNEKMCELRPRVLTVVLSFSHEARHVPTYRFPAQTGKARMSC